MQFHNCFNCFSTTKKNKKEMRGMNSGKRKRPCFLQGPDFLYQDLTILPGDKNVHRWLRLLLPWLCNNTNDYLTTPWCCMLGKSFFTLRHSHFQCYSATARILIPEKTLYHNNFECKRLLAWLLPSLNAESSRGGNRIQQNRVFVRNAAILFGVWSMSLLCSRKYFPLQESIGRIRFSTLL